MFRRLLSHTDGAGFGSWKINYFTDIAMKANILSDPMTDFLSNPTMGKTGDEYHFEYRAGSRVCLKEFMNKFDCFMQFEKKRDYDPGQINVELSLVKAADIMICGPAPSKGAHMLKVAEIGGYTCKHCNEDIEINWGHSGDRLDGSPADTCCSAYHFDQRPKTTKKKKDIDTKAVRHKSRLKAPHIKNLALVKTGTRSSKRGGVSHNAIPWNATCKCVRKHMGLVQGNEQAVKKTSNSENNRDREYWTCLKNGCDFFAWADEMSSPASSGGTRV
jgi:hypothetical protein